MQFEGNSTLEGWRLWDLEHREKQKQLTKPNKNVIIIVHKYSIFELF